jgi:hypothetical protein
MARWLPILFLIALAPRIAAAQTAPQQPPIDNDGNFADTETCPLSCCNFGNWSVEAATPLFEKPLGGRQVGTAAIGQNVEGIAGVLLTQPIPVTVVQPYVTAEGIQFGRGEQFWILTNLGEGYSRIWHRGELKELDVAPMIDRATGRFTSCATASAQCWWSIREEHRSRRSSWRLQVKLRSGITGWTEEAQNFGNIDICN